MSAAIICKQMAQARVDAHQGIVAVDTHARKLNNHKEIQPPACIDLREVLAHHPPELKSGRFATCGFIGFVLLHHVLGSALFSFVELR